MTRPWLGSPLAPRQLTWGARCVFISAIVSDFWLLSLSLLTLVLKYCTTHTPTPFLATDYSLYVVCLGHSRFALTRLLYSGHWRASRSEYLTHSHRCRLRRSQSLGATVPVAGWLPLLRLCPRKPRDPLIADGISSSNGTYTFCWTRVRSVAASTSKSLMHPSLAARWTARA